MISEDTKQRLKDAIPLSSIIKDSMDLTPAGPDEWKGLCPFHNDKNPSFTVNDSKGFFHCFSCDANGDVFEWLDRKNNLPFTEAVNFLANRLGISIEHEDRLMRPADMSSRPAPKREPLEKDRFRALQKDGAVYRYLTEERKLSPDVLKSYAVGETSDGQAYAFAYKERRGKRTYTQFLKCVKLQRTPEGKKDEWRYPKGGKNILFGLLAAEEMSPDRDSLIITEGEIDALSWATYGYAAVSIPCGATSTAWIEVNYEWLQAWNTIHINFDEDRAGRSKVEEVVKRLGIERCDILRLPLIHPEQKTEELEEDIEL